ncbi:MAG TPA: biotin transporter BioY [Glaciihabitans sp.]|nr:biotin transporter BioY [Glaciihabitans sp.]
MTQVALVGGRATLADQFITRSIATDAALVVAGAALTAVAAQIAVPLWPVPITGQTLAVLLVGSTLGAARGALSMVLYAILGVVGLPIFSDASSGLAVLTGTTGGYIVGFIASAALVGWVAERAGDRKFLGAALAFGAGTIVTFAFGMIWLAAVLGTDLAKTLEYGLYPFIIGGVVKSLLAASIIPVVWLGVERINRNKK